jgi:pilus assembly protein CpaD
MKLEHLFRVLAVGSILVAGSCSAANDGSTISEDGARNHPIAVEPSYATITFFGERAAASGISRDKILVTTREAGNSDTRVDVSYIAYTAHAQSCGDWSENEAFTLDNHTSANFGCSIQHNIAAMVADPRDLLGPGAMGPVSTNRRATVLDHYERGEVTQAEKRTADKPVEQSAGASSIGQ